MPATSARIGFVMNEWRSAIAEDPAVKSTWGAAARDTSAQKDPASSAQDRIDAEQPVPTYFDSVADAQAVVDQRLNLLKVGRRMFDVTMGELLDFSGALAFEVQVPAVGFIDPEKAADFTGLLVSIDALDFETGRTTVQVWG